MTFGSDKDKYYIEFSKVEYERLKEGKTLHHYVESRTECAEIILSFDYKRKEVKKYD